MVAIQSNELMVQSLLLFPRMQGFVNKRPQMVMKEIMVMSINGPMQAEVQRQFEFME